MDTRISATDLARNLAAVLNRIRDRGEHFIVERNGVPIATLAPTTPHPPAITLSEVAARLGDLPLPGNGFADDLAAAQAAQPAPARG